MINSDDKKDMQELEELWEKNNDNKNDYDDFEDEAESNEESIEHKYSSVPILQMAVCAIILVALIYFKFADTPKYDEAVKWYKNEISQEIELPTFNKKEEKVPQITTEPEDISSEKTAPESI